MPVTVWKGQLTFGLVSILIRIVRAAREERVRFRHVYAAPAAEPERSIEQPAPVQPFDRNMLHSVPAGKSAAPPEPEPEPIEVAPVRTTFTAEDTGERLASRDVLKGYEYSKGEFAVFRPEELRRLRAETTRDMEIIEFVKLSGIDPVYFNASYYVAPDRGGDKPYALLFDAMRRTGFAALARFAMHGRERILALRPGRRGITMHTLFYESEIHAADESTADISLVTPQEMKLAELLISQLSGEFDASKFKDERMARIQESIEQKIAASPATAARSSAAPAAPVVDILDALRRSLEKKPAVKESAAKKSPRPRKASA